MATFPDAQPYFGVVGGVKRIVTGTNVLETKWWIHNGGDTYNDTSVYCGLPPAPGHSMCYGGSLYSAMLQTTDGKEYGVVLGNIGGDKSELFELYPTLQYQTTLVADIKVATAAGANVVVSGLNASGQNITTVFNTTTAQETALIGPENEIEIYHLTYLSNANAVLFDGLRFADNQYVIGRIDLSTHQLSVLNTSSARWADLQVFPGG
jgi:hypothetical protein